MRNLFLLQQDTLLLCFFSFFSRVRAGDYGVIHARTFTTKSSIKTNNVAARRTSDNLLIVI